jgi:hypothetical protein
MDEIAQAIAARRPGSLTAMEGMRLVAGEPVFNSGGE